MLLPAARDLVGHADGWRAAVQKVRISGLRVTGFQVLLACSSTSPHASADRDVMARDLRKLAMMALPPGIKVAFEGLS